MSGPCGCFGAITKYSYPCKGIPRPTYYMLSCDSDILSSDDPCADMDINLDNYSFPTDITALLENATYQGLSSTVFVPYVAGLSSDNTVTYNSDDYTEFTGNNRMSEPWVGYTNYINDYIMPEEPGYDVSRQLWRDLLYEYEYDGDVWEFNNMYTKNLSGVYKSTLTATNFYQFDVNDMFSLVQYGSTEPGVLIGCSVKLYIDTSWFAWSVSGTELADDSIFWVTDSISGLSSWYGGDASDRLGLVNSVMMLTSTSTYPNL